MLYPLVIVSESECLDVFKISSLGDLLHFDELEYLSIGMIRKIVNMQCSYVLIQDYYCHNNVNLCLVST